MNPRPLTFAPLRPVGATLLRRPDGSPSRVALTAPQHATFEEVVKLRAELDRVIGLWREADPLDRPIPFRLKGRT